MDKLTLDQVQELYYTENADYEDEALTPIEVLERTFGQHCEVDETPDFMESFIDNFLKVASTDIVEWIFDVSSFDMKSAIFACTNDDFHHKYLQRFIDEKKYVGQRFTKKEVKRLIELMKKFDVEITEHLIDNIQIIKVERSLFINEIDYIIHCNGDISDHNKFMYEVFTRNK